MKKVLVIANEFPPMGGSGVQRTTKFVKYLPQFDIEPIVVTKEHVGSLTDETLLNDLPKNLKIYRLKPYDMVNKKGLFGLGLKFIGTRLLSPDAEFFWYYFNKGRVEEIIKKHQIECIYTTSYPYSSHLMGLYLKRKFPNIKWITDFRDEWTNNPYHLDDFYKRLRFKFEKKKELAITSECDFLITNTQLMLDNFIRDNPTLKGRSTYIPNGYDDDDFIGLINQRDGEDKFVITHTGSLYGRRNLTEFLDGLKIAIDDGRIDKDRLEIRIVGNVYQKVLDEYVEKYNLQGIIKGYGYMPHRESIQMLYNSDLLLLLIGKGKGSENFYTGKLFEYIKADREILGIVPKNGAAAQVIVETNTGVVIDPENIEEIANAVAAYYNDWKNYRMHHNPNWDKVENYSRKSQAGELAGIINNLL